VAAGHGSLFSYCTQALCLSEHAAHNRIEAARASRRFPVILDLLASGAVNLSTVRLLAPHLTPDNCRDLLGQASGRSKREDSRGACDSSRGESVAPWTDKQIRNQMVAYSERTRQHGAG
jgi:hypothetical protein